MDADRIVLSVEDAAKLTNLLEVLKPYHFPDWLQIRLLGQTMESAEVVASDSIPPEVVRIHCAVRVVNLQTGKRRRYTVVSPELADMAKRLLSAVAPLGIALLGHKQGDLVEARVPGGVRLLKIERVRHLPRPRDNRPARLSNTRVLQLGVQPN